MNTKKPQKNMMTKPINLLFKLFQSKTRVQIWLYEEGDLRFEGKIIGFDEYMNLVIDECEEINVGKSTRVYLGRIMLKGDNLTLVRPLEVSS
mmetsp:Transcript_25993/g.27101  ORF Transcript_25993/g.27101 Transcript_25993/m.27101 type:complete len:92 (-) Transcript_25993:48-323(-)